MANYVYIATSLDDFIATSEGGIEWLDDVPNPGGSDFGFSEFIAGVDAIVMGRVTFEKVLTFDHWPYPIPVVVLSGTLHKPPPALEGKVWIDSGPVKDAIARLNARGLVNLYIDGGRVIQACLREDLIEELIVTRFPKLLGSGIPLFGELGVTLDFIHVETVVIENHLVKSRYRRVRKPHAG